MSSLVMLFAVFVMFVLVAAIAFLFWRYTLIQDRLHALETSLVKDAPVEYLPHLKLVIHKPHKVAQRESRLAKAMGAVSPEYIKYRVYKQVAEELELALNEREIDVSIELVGMKGSTRSAKAGATEPAAKPGA